MSKKINVNKIVNFDCKYGKLTKVKLHTDSAIPEGSEFSGTLSVLDTNGIFRVFVTSGLKGRITSPLNKINKLGKKTIQFETDTSTYEFKVLDGK